MRLLKYTEIKALKVWTADGKVSCVCIGKRYIVQGLSIIGKQSAKQRQTYTLVAYLFNFRMTALSVVKSGLSAGSSVQHRFINTPTSSSQLKSATLGLRHFSLLFTLSTISVKFLKKISFIFSRTI